MYFLEVRAVFLSVWRLWIHSLWIFIIFSWMCACKPLPFIKADSAREGGCGHRAAGQQEGGRASKHVTEDFNRTLACRLGMGKSPPQWVLLERSGLRHRECRIHGINWILLTMWGSKITECLWKLANSFPSDEEKTWKNMWQYRSRELLRPGAVEVLCQRSTHDGLVCWSTCPSYVQGWIQARAFLYGFACSQVSAGAFLLLDQVL